MLETTDLYSARFTRETNHAHGVGPVCCYLNIKQGVFKTKRRSKRRPRLRVRDLRDVPNQRPPLRVVGRDLLKPDFLGRADHAMAHHTAHGRLFELNWIPFPMPDHLRPREGHSNALALV